MARKSEIESPRHPPVVITRRFPAPRALVFQAWSTAEHIKRWFSPSTYTVPDAEIDFRPGGVCAICMRSPDGQDFWSRGKYLEIVPPERLVFSIGLVMAGETRFTAHTVVVFEEEGAGTRLTVRQEYDVHDEAFASSIEGAPEGWRTTLDKLEREVARIAGQTEARSVVHATFRIERTYDAPPSLVFRALSDKAAKDRWFGGGDSFTALEREMDVRPGGRERLRGRWKSGMETMFDAVYFDVVPDTRLVYCYEMTLDGRKISVSLATMEIIETGTGTRLVVTEQGAFLDGYDDAGKREEGTGFLLDRLGASLAA
jgi:uncharacterized protein YndB with AHSA1/START domain